LEVIVTTVFRHIIHNTGSFDPHEMHFGPGLHGDGDRVAHGIMGALGEINTYYEIFFIHNNSIYG
jgi:hypothetical protein